MKSINGPHARLVVKTKTADLIKIRESLNGRRSLGHGQGQGVGFVPTMGNLHQGHLRLLEAALKNHSCVFFSIFVNPKQFGPQEDFQKYPRTLEEDVQKIHQVLQKPSNKNKKVIVFAPKEINEVFPPGFSTTISLGPLTQIYCGKFRPGHFDGVTTVVYRLFSLISPHCAYFGKKDFQQTVVIRKMVEDLRLPVTIKTLPTVREKNGLALSSRNQYLNPQEKQEALCLYQTLKDISSLIGKGPWTSEIGDKVNDFITRTLTNPKNPPWDYLSVCETKNLLPPTPASKHLVVLGALRMGKTRLIDNVEIKLKNA